MKAVAVAPVQRAVSVVDDPPPPTPRSSGVTPRVLEARTCRTDREFVSSVHGTQHSAFGYLPIGHESIGENVSDVNALA